MLTSLVVVPATGLVSALLLWPRLRAAPCWRAATTPLASIIGSGFLVLGPLLVASFGGFAPLAMLALCATAWAFGSAIRFNIKRIGDGNDRLPTALEEWIDNAASGALAFAYFISVAYYLNLFGAFALSKAPDFLPRQHQLLTSAVLIFIFVIGWLKGFGALERMEQIAVGIKLAIIGGLLAGLSMHFGEATASADLHWQAPLERGWHAATLLFGLIVTVQGFETSRYMQAGYDAETRVRAMRVAQIVATAIYMFYILLMTYSFEESALALKETAIIDLTALVSPILPLMLIFAALAAQFSAAIADTSGAGGLLAELSGRRMKPRDGYLVLTLVGLLLTWRLNVFEIISYASRAFALYYALQCLIAAIGANRSPLRRGCYALLTVFALAITVFGVAVEG